MMSEGYEGDLKVLLNIDYKKWIQENLSLSLQKKIL